MAKVRLTDANVKSAKAAAGERLELFDQKTVGLILRVSDSGRKSWAVRYRTLAGQQRRHALGRYPELGLADAREEALAVMRQARSGRDPSAEKVAARRKAVSEPLKTMADLHDAYFTACETGEWRPRKKRKRASTIAEEKALWRRHIAEGFNSLRVEEIDHSTVRRLLRSIVAAGSPVTSNRVRALLRQSFNFAISEERVVANPIDKVPPLASETPRERVLGDAELKMLWVALSSRALLEREGPGGKGTKVRVSEAMGIALKLLTLTLTRRAEVAGMTRSELDLDNATWIIPSERAKNGTAHSVPLSAPAVALIKRAIEIADEGREKPSPVVFPSPRDRQKAITPGALSHVLRELRLALKLGDIRAHDLRRTGASVMVSERLGISPFVVGRVLNHSSETGGASAVTLRHYALHDYASEKRGALQVWANLLRQIVGETTASKKVVPIRGAA